MRAGVPVMLLVAAVLAPVACTTVPPVPVPSDFTLSFPDDLSFLIGTWLGEINLPNDPFGPKRWMTIRAVRPLGEGWRFEGTYGSCPLQQPDCRIDTSAGDPIEGALEIRDGRPRLSFLTNHLTRIDVTLEAPDRLGGTFVPHLAPTARSLTARIALLRRVPLARLDLRMPAGADVHIFWDAPPPSLARYVAGESGAVRIFLWPGAYEVLVQKSGFQAWRHRLEVASGDRRIERTAALVATPASPEPSPPGPQRAAAPVIVLNHPVSNITVSDADLVILGLVTDDEGVAAVEVSVNGAAVPPGRDVTVTGRSVAVRVPVVLRPGQNLIEVTARNGAGRATQVVRTVTRTDAALGWTDAKAGTRWAVLVGVGHYERAGIPALRYAVRDADAMYEFLVTRGGWPRENVLLLTDATADKPSLLNIKRALGEILPRRVGRDDTVLIYFAGHGAPEPDVSGTESDGIAKYLVPRDGDPDALYTTALPMDEIQRIFARIQSNRIVLLLDTCYSGAAGGRTFARRQTRATALDDKFLERLVRSKGRVIITASGPSEVALELAELGHGLFTYHLLRGLEGQADHNRDGIVTISELYEYVEEQVERQAREIGGRQRPLLKGEIEGALPLVRSPR